MTKEQQPYKEKLIVNRHYPDTRYLCRLANLAGEVMVQNFSLGMRHRLKNDDTPVTDSDERINRLVIDSIKADFPHIRVIGEEECYRADDETEYTILCDPVDGTIPFCRGAPISSFVISVIQGNQPLVAVIHDPILNRMWFAAKGEGAWINRAPVHVSSHNTVKNSNICMVWWKGSPYHLHQVAEELMKRGATWGNPLTIAYYGGLLASGQQDATIFPGRKGWETAAMQLIAEEAGGKATNIYGFPLTYGPKGEIEGHIISNGVIHDELVEIVNSR